MNFALRIQDFREVTTTKGVLYIHIYYICIKLRLWKSPFQDLTCMPSLSRSYNKLRKDDTRVFNDMFSEYTYWKGIGRQIKVQFVIVRIDLFSREGFPLKILGRRCILYLFCVFLCRLFFSSNPIPRLALVAYISRRPNF